MNGGDIDEGDDNDDDDDDDDDDDEGEGEWVGFHPFHHHHHHHTPSPSPSSTSSSSNTNEIHITSNSTEACNPSALNPANPIEDDIQSELLEEKGKREEMETYQSPSSDLSLDREGIAFDSPTEVDKKLPSSSPSTPSTVPSGSV